MPLSKQALLVENNTNFPNNNTGYITPALLREFNADMIDAMQLTQSMSEYAVLSGSNSFIGNQTITGNLNVTGVISASVLHVQYETASVIFSTGSNQLGDELTDVQTLSGSVKIQGQLLINGVPLSSGSATVDTGSLVTTASFNAYTQSANQRLTSLETNSASVNISISNLNQTTASLNTSVSALNQFTQSQNALNGTFATTGSNTFTGNQIIDRASKLYTNGIYWTDMTAGFNNLEIINQGGGNLDFASLNGGRMRVVNTPLILTGSTLSSNSDISTSANVYGANLTASAIPAGTISSSAQISALGFVSSSVTASSLITASLSGQTLTFTKGDSSTFGIVLPDVSGSDITALNAFTASQLTINTGYNTFTQSANTSISNLNAATASYVTETESGSFLLTASFDNNTRDLTFTKGNNTTFAVNIPDVSGSTINTGSFATTASFNSYTQSNDQRVSSLEVNSASVNISIANINTTTASLNSSVTQLNANTASQQISIDNLNTNSASVNISISNINSATASLFTSASLALVTASVNNDDITFTKGDGSTFTIQVATGSFAISASYAETASYAQFATDIYLNVKNTTGAQLNKGTVVRIIGATGDNALIQTASWTNDANSANTLGLLYENIANDGFGKAITQGTLLGIDTDPTLGYTAGQLLYLSSSGQYTNVKPDAPYHEVRLGQVLRAQQNNGSMYVLIQNGYELDELHDVDINTGSLANNDLLAYNSASGQWENKTVSGVGATTTSSFNSYTSSNDQKVNSLIAATGSYVTSAITASSLVTASVNLNTITFTKGDGTTFPITVNTGSGGGGSTDTGSLMVTGSVNVNVLTFTKGDGSTFDLTVSSSGSAPAGTVSSSAQILAYGIFATTGSNTFTGNQTINKNGAEYQLIDPSIPQAGTTSIGISGASGGLIFKQSGSVLIEGQAGQTGLVFYGTGSFNRGIAISDSDFVAGATIRYDTTNDVVIIEKDGTFKPSLNIEGTLTASLENGYVWVGNASGRTVTVATSSFGGGAVGNFATTGSNVFTGDQTLVDAAGNSVTLSDVSGSLMLVAKTFTSASTHFTASAGNQVNLIFKNNNNTGDTILSGSNNIFTNPNTPTAGRTNYIGGSTNLFLNGQSLQLPQITGSAASVSGNRPTMNANIIAGTQAWTINQAVNTGTHTYSNNILAGTGTWTFNTTGNTGPVSVQNNLGLTSTMTLNSPSRSVTEINAGQSGSNVLTITNNSIAGTLAYNGPVSSSTHFINQNNIAGTVTFNVQSQSRAITSTANIINGTFTYNDNTFFAPTVGSTNIFQNNNINGAATFTLAGSSSFQAVSNNLGTISITSFLNAASATNAANRTSTLNNNAIFGNNNSILFSGSVGVAPTGRTLNANLIAGQFISASLIGDGSGSNMFGTAILGGGLNVIGTTTIAAAGLQQNYGSAFFGRWNAEDGNRAKTAETIFAVGTGISGSTGITRKTGFLIDSGSNSYFEGTLNVSGSTTITGSLILSSSAAVELQVIGESQFTGSVSVSNVLQLGQLNPLPTGADGQLAVSASNLYFYSGSAWNKISFG